MDDPMSQDRNSWPKISIVTPSYNQGQFVEETILSVIDQNYPNLEYIIVDGGSTDNTVEIIKKYEKHISYWVSEPDQGQSHAINKGVEKCTGDVFNWLNSDDYYEPNAMLKVGEAFKDPHTYILSGRERRINAMGQEVGLSDGTSIMDSLSETIGKCHIDQPSTFFRLSILKSLLPFDDSFHYLMDGEMWLRYLLCLGQSQIKKTKDILVNFRYHSSSKTTSASEKFQIDKNTFENNLIRNFKIDESVKSILLTRKANSVLKELKVNQNINESVITSFFCARSIEHFYAVGKYKEAKKCLQFIDNYYPKLYKSKVSLKYYKRILILPGSVITAIRTLKDTISKSKLIQNIVIVFTRGFLTSANK